MARHPHPSGNDGMDDGLLLSYLPYLPFTSLAAEQLRGRLSQNKIGYKGVAKEGCISLIDSQSERDIRSQKHPLLLFFVF